jgi:hypothetical protein
MPLCIEVVILNGLIHEILVSRMEKLYLQLYKVWKIDICVSLYIKIFIVMCTYFTITAPVKYLICQRYAEKAARL